jgi:hypothetical protein
VLVSETNTPVSTIGLKALPPASISVLSTRKTSTVHQGIKANFDQSLVFLVGNEFTLTSKSQIRLEAACAWFNFDCTYICVRLLQQKQKASQSVKAREEQARYVKCDTLSVTKSGSILLDAILLKIQPTALFDLRGGASHYFHLRMQIPSERVGYIGTNNSGVMGMCTLAVYPFCIVTT